MILGVVQLVIAGFLFFFFFIASGNVSQEIKGMALLFCVVAWGLSIATGIILMQGG